MPLRRRHTFGFPRQWSARQFPSWPVEVDRGHPLARDLSGLWLIGLGSETPPNIVTGAAAIPASGGGSGSSLTNSGYFQATRTEFGPAIRPYSVAGTTFWILGTEPDIIGANSTFMLIRRKTTANSSSAAFGSYGSSYVNVHFPWSDGNIYWDYPDSGSRVSAAYTASSLPSVWILSGGSAGRFVYRDGVSVISNTGTTTTASPSTSRQFSLNWGAATGDDQEIIAFATWKRQLSAAEMAMVSAQPYAMLRPKIRRALFVIGEASSNTGSGTGTIGAPSAIGIGGITQTGSGTGTIGAPSAVGTGGITQAGSGTGTIGAPSAVGTGTITQTGTGVATIGAPSAVGTGGITQTGSGTGTIGAPSAVGTGTITQTGTGVATIAAPSAVGTGTINTGGAVGVATIGAPSAVGTGGITQTGTGVATISAPSAVGTGIFNTGGAVGVATIGAPSAVGTGTVSQAGSGVATIGAPSAVGTGSIATGAGVGVATIGAPSAVGTGTVSVAGSGTGTIGAPSAVGAGNITQAGSGTGTIGAPSAVGIGSLSLTGVGVATVPAPEAFGTTIPFAQFATILPGRPRVRSLPGPRRVRLFGDQQRQRTRLIRGGEQEMYVGFDFTEMAPTEDEFLGFDFAPTIGTDTLSSVAWTLSVVKGSDAAAASHLGTSSITGTKATVRVSGLVSGVRYRLTGLATCGSLQKKELYSHVLCQ